VELFVPLDAFLQSTEMRGILASQSLFSVYVGRRPVCRFACFVSPSACGLFPFGTDYQITNLYQVEDKIGRAFNMNGEKTTYRILVGKPGALEIPRLYVGDLTVKWILERMGWYGLDRSGSG
jgi:hypothetical protein